MEPRPHESLDGKRAELTASFNEAMARLNAMEKAHDVAVAMMNDWRGAREGREARIYVGDACLMITLALARGEIFGDAAETFAAAEPAIRAAFPETWEGDWSEVEDKSEAHEARRQSILHVSPPGGRWYSDGVSIWLTVAARIAEGSACQVVKVGERVERYSTPIERMVPVYKSICPGDPAPMAAE